MSDKTPAGPDVTKSEPTLQDQVTTALANVDDGGKLVFEDNVDPMFKELVITTKRSKDTQSAYTKGQMELATTKAAKEALENKITSTTPQLSAEQTDELENLKFSDPDAWRAKLNEYEGIAKAKASGELEEITKAASEKAAADLTLTQRQEALTEFESRTGIQLTDDVMQNDIPPRLQAKITSMSFEQYLAEVATYLGKKKVVKDEKLLEQTDLSKLAGTGSQKGSTKKSEITIL